MPKIEGEIKVLVYSDSGTTSNPKKRNFDYKLDINSTLTQFPSPTLISIADATVDQVIPFYSGTYKYLFIFTDKEISVKLNGGSQSIKIKSFYACDGEFTGLSISNASGSVANISIGFGI